MKLYLVCLLWVLINSKKRPEISNDSYTYNLNEKSSSNLNLYRRRSLPIVNLKQNFLVIESRGFDYNKNKCEDPYCSYCNPLNPNKCLKCATGYFLISTFCQESCPTGYKTDVIQGKCIPKAMKLNKGMFTKAYTKGSCINRCGHQLSDCSCNAKCELNGNCCSDYFVHNCPILIDQTKILGASCSSKMSNCDLCDKRNEKLKCVQCFYGMYLYKDECHDECPVDTFPDNDNFICNDIMCTIHN